jgi:hypothetical protein
MAFPVEPPTSPSRVKDAVLALLVDPRFLKLFPHRVKAEKPFLSADLA